MAYEKLFSHSGDRTVLSHEHQRAVSDLRRQLLRIADVSSIGDGPVYTETDALRRLSIETQVLVDMVRDFLDDVETSF